MSQGTYTIKKVGGLIKKIPGEHFRMDMGIGAVLQDITNCIGVYEGDIWNWAYETGGRQLLLFEPGAWLDFQIDVIVGQHGCLLVRNGFKVEVISSDTGDDRAYIARASEVKYSWQNDSEIRALAHRPAVGDVLFAGDMLDFSPSHTGQYKITNLCEGWSCFAPGQNEMPGLEEGFNEVNIFALDVNLDQPPLMRVRTPRPTRVIRSISG
jgi:hypothetical protein